MAFVLCAPVVAQVGFIPTSREPVDGVFEDWCGFDIDEWVEFGEDNSAITLVQYPTEDSLWGITFQEAGEMSARPYCAFAGSVPIGQYRIDAKDPPEHLTTVGGGIANNPSVGGIDLRGSQIYFRLDRARLADRTSGFEETKIELTVDLDDPRPEDPLFLTFDLFYDDANGLRWGLNPVTGSLAAIPDSEDNWTWIRFTHDAATDEVALWTAADCGEWIYRAGTTFTGNLDSLRLRMLSYARDNSVTEPLDATGPVWSVIYQEPFPAPGPTPEATP